MLRVGIALSETRAISRPTRAARTVSPRRPLQNAFAVTPHSQRMHNDHLWPCAYHAKEDTGLSEPPHPTSSHPVLYRAALAAAVAPILSRAAICAKLLLLMVLTLPLLPCRWPAPGP